MQAAWEELHQENMYILNVASVDCTTTKGNELCEMFGVRGYPTLMYLPEGDSGVYHTY